MFQPEESQLPVLNEAEDHDPLETREWLESLGADFLMMSCRIAADIRWTQGG